MSVLVSDAQTKHALAATRSLGRRGLRVITASHSRFSMAFLSRYSKSARLYAPPHRERDFLEDILRIIKKDKVEVILPIGPEAAIALAKNLDLFRGRVGIPLPDYSSLMTAYDKGLTVKLAQECAVPHPRTYFPQSVEEVQQIAPTLSYPIVVKARKSAGARQVYYANSPGELVVCYKSLDEPLIQEYIPGQDIGFFALFDHSSPVALFSHRRIRQYPHTGGPSTLAESTKLHPAVKEYSLRLLEKLKWHGVAMVEYRLDSRDGIPKLIEINPKFWGSLELAIAAGVDFPYLAYRLALGEKVAPVLHYQEGVRFRWLLPDDFMHLLTAPKKGIALRNFLRWDGKNTHYDILLSDPLPLAMQIAKTAYWIYRDLLRPRMFKK